MEINLYYIKWHGKAFEVSKAPIEALLNVQHELELTEPNSPRLQAIQKEVKKRNAKT